MARTLNEVLIGKVVRGTALTRHAVRPDLTSELLFFDRLVGEH